MARIVIWSYEATADLEAIADYIARDPTFYAASFPPSSKANRVINYLSINPADLIKTPENGIISFTYYLACQH